ncbi:tetratricopeptide repeat (TPR)-like superfamily protein [Tasmannia lanceolata]|uniref:tetratricopeptide repeat (TPR)-like superfamily protein n=1 Tax=Tasmannia lanceolata TaxID=3420 RepID=UPI0040649CEF
MASISDRQELAKLCSSRDWSKAIRVLDSLLSQSCAIQDICNRAFCYSQLELHKHVIKDCDSALQLDSTLLQAYILKGHALSALGKKEDALFVWEEGYRNAVRQSADLKQLLELEELLASAKQNGTIVCAEQATDSSSTITSGDADSGISSKSTETSEIHRKTKETVEIHSKSTDGAKFIQKAFATGISKTKSIGLDFRLSRGIAQVNEGKYDKAVSIFDQILKENPTSSEALIGRGTAYAFQRELDTAITDFTKAIESNPLAGEAWKRRGQARAALGESVQAIEDLTKALEFEPNSPDILHERGIVNFKFKDFNAAVEDLSSCVMLDKVNKSAYTYLGLALSSIAEYRRAEEAHMKSIEIDPNFLEGWTHLAQFYQDLANSEKALDCLKQVLIIDERFAKAYHLRGLLHHGMGEHRNAIKDLSIGLSIERSSIECLYLRGSCYHAIGQYGDAVKDYNAVLDLELDSVEKFVLQCLAFYQKEVALYTASKICSEFCWFDIDGDLDPLFKEYWCKRLHPKDVCEKVYRQPPLRESLKKGRLRKQDFTVTKQKATLLQAADFIGKKIQYNCPGFLPNRCQHRMAGLAAIEIAQKVSKAWRSLQLEWKFSSKSTTKTGKKARKKEKVNVPSQNRGGACCSTSSSSEPSTSYGFSDDRSGSSRFMMSWQEVYSLGVRWRQISEPCDPVVWVNKLSEEFNSGFGSHTPMVLGQAKVVRYFPNCERTLNVAKAIIGETMYVHNTRDGIIDLSEGGKLQKIMNAGSCSDLYSVVGEDFWLATSCNSTAFEGKRLEGTRITFQKMGNRGFDFAIRTPCTPSRWADFDAEMAMAWEALCNAYCGEVYGSTDIDMLENVRDSILKLTYYWYNFIPLSRGTAAVGYVVLLGLFLAANMEVTGSIPQGAQVDWEAILSPNPETFIDSIKPWLYPSLQISTSWKDYPDVASTFSTTGSVVAALSSNSD